MRLPDQIEVVIDDADRDVVSVSIRFWTTRIELLGRALEQGDTLFVDTAHILVTGPARLTPMLIDCLAQRVLEETGYDNIHLAGAIRTSGARRGTRPRLLRFARKG